MALADDYSLPNLRGRNGDNKFDFNMVGLEMEDEDDVDEDNDEDDLLLSPEESKVLQKRGFDSLAERLKVQLTAKNGRIQYLKDVIRQLEADLIKAIKSKPQAKVDKGVFFDKDRSRVRIRQLQDEVTALSAQVRNLKDDNERQLGQDHGNEQRIQYLLEELEKERDRVQKMSVQLAACRRKESEHRNLEVEVHNLRAQKKRREHEHKSNAHILKVNKVKRAEHMRLFRRGIEGLNELNQTFPYGKRSPRKGSTPRKSLTPRTGRDVHDNKDNATSQSLWKKQENELFKETKRQDPKLLLPRHLASHEVAAKSHETRPIVMLLPRGNVKIRTVKSGVTTGQPENVNLRMLLPRKLKKPEQASCMMSLPKPMKGSSSEESTDVLLPRPTKQNSRQERCDITELDAEMAKEGNNGSISLQTSEPPSSLKEQCEKAELDAQLDIRQLRRDLGLKMQKIKNMDAQLQNRDEEIRTLQALAGSPIPRPISPEEEDDEDREYDKQYIKQLQTDLALKNQTIKNLNMQLVRRDEELKVFQTCGASPMPRPLRETCEDTDELDAQQEIRRLQRDLGTKLQTIRNLNDQIDKRDDEINNLQRQLCSSHLEAAQRWPWSVWDNKCYEDPGTSAMRTPETLSEDATLTPLRQRITELETELGVLRSENNKLKSELEAVDPEEIEDLKLENHELSQLCERYEKMLHSYCGQLGVPFKPLRSTQSY